MSEHGARQYRWLELSIAVPVGIVILLVLLAGAMPESIQRTVAQILATAVIVLGLQIFIGNSGIYSFGHMAFGAVGAYVSAILTVPEEFRRVLLPGLPDVLQTTTVPGLWATVLAGLAAGLVALVVALPTMRTSTLAIPISTLAMLLVTFEVVANWDRVTRGASGLIGIPLTTTVASAAAWVCIAVVLALVFRRSSLGLRLQATRDNEIAARAVGIGVTGERLVAFVISGALAGVGGSLLVHQSGVLTPDTFYFNLTLVTLTMLVVGGARSVLGAVVGSLSVSLVNELFRAVEGGISLGPLRIGARPGLAPIGLSFLLLAVLLLRPSGIMGSREAADLGLFAGLAGMRRHAREMPPGEKATSPALVLEPGRTLEASAALEARDVSVSFAGLRALDEVDVSLRAGEILGLIGPNGAGKTTLINVLSGFQPPTTGAVILDGEDVTDLKPSLFPRRGLARTFQMPLPFVGFSTLENVALGALGVGVDRQESHSRAVRILQRLGLESRSETPAGALPLGEQRLLGVARALATHPRYLLLDEPAAGLTDEEGGHLVASLLKIREEYGCGLLIVEHRVGLVMSLCQRVQVLDAGKTLMVDTPAAVQESPAVISAYLGSSFSTQWDA